MHPRLEQCLRFLAQERSALLQVIDRAEPDVLQKRPAAESWSAAEILQHLHLVETQVTALIDRAVQKARAAGLRAETSAQSLLPALDRFQLTDRSRKQEAPASVRPTREVAIAEVRGALAASRAALVAVLEAADGLALGEVSRPHPLLGTITLYEWVLFVGQHEARHAAQIADTLKRFEPGAHAGGAGELVVLDRDHPGFRDADYRARRNHIARVALDYRGGPVPAVDYTEAEHAVWRQVWRTLEPLHEQWAPRGYLILNKRLNL